MPNRWWDALERAALSGSVAGVATSATVALAGVREGGSAVAPLNATSHIVWGESAGQVEQVDGRHTLLGLALNLGACIFWATFFERLVAGPARRRQVGRVVAGAGAVAATAYVTDYHLVPRRLTPGWEARLSGRSLATAYGVLAVSLALTALLRDR